MTGQDARSTTPTGTPTVVAPPPCATRQSRGAALVGCARVLAPNGLLVVETDSVALVGRAETCDIVLNDPLSSRRHARIVAMEDSVVLDDLQSRNGTYLNGVRLELPTRLHVGDRIIVGTTELSVFAP